MSSGRGPSLAERSARTLSVKQEGPGAARHCWVVDPAEATGRWPGLVVEWRRAPDGGRWQARTLYVVTAEDRRVLIEDWVDAAQLIEA